jgi:hypothetical protein
VRSSDSYYARPPRILQQFQNGKASPYWVMPHSFWFCAEGALEVRQLAKLAAAFRLQLVAIERVNEAFKESASKLAHSKKH